SSPTHAAVPSAECVQEHRQRLFLGLGQDVERFAREAVDRGLDLTVDDDSQTRRPRILTVLPCRASGAGSGDGRIDTHHLAGGPCHHLHCLTGDDRAMGDVEQTMLDVTRIGHDSACEPLTGPLGRREVAGDPATGERLRNGDTDAVLGAEAGEALCDARGLALMLFEARHVCTLLRVGRTRAWWRTGAAPSPACSGQKRAPANRGSDVDYALLSVAAVYPIWRAQWEQQYMAPSASTPWPRMRHSQCAQLGAIFAIAHSKLSNVPDSWPRVMVNARS